MGQRAGNPFAAAKRDPHTDHGSFKQAVPELRSRLVRIQRALHRDGVPAIVLLSGMEGAGKGHVVNRLNAWLDPRHLEVHAFWDPSDEARQRPAFWRFWQALPAAGTMSVLFGAWYQEPLDQALLGHRDGNRVAAAAERIVALERMLVEDGRPIIKLWYHMSETARRERLASLGRDDRSRCHRPPSSRKGLHRHDARFERIAERLLLATDTPAAPWHVVAAADPRHRDLTTGHLLAATLAGRLASGPPEGPLGAAATSAAPAADTSQDRPSAHASGHEHYRKRLRHLQDELDELAWLVHERGRSVVAVFEGVDAAGKGGAIRRVLQGVDARLVRTHRIAAPTEEERAQHYLWRFWRRLPRDGYLALFDRSWYGRVLVERVEGLTPEWRWRRAFDEIADFEAQLHEHGTVVAKIWLQIDADEQLARFRVRERTPHKRHKITPEDWRNRARWDAYRVAVDEMMARTHTASAPWTVVDANDKHAARIRVLETLVDALRSGPSKV